MTVEELQALVAASPATAHIAIGVVWFAEDGYQTASAALDDALKREFGALVHRSVARLSRLTSQAYSAGDDLTRGHIGSMSTSELGGGLIHPKADEALRDLRKLSDAEPLTADALDEVPAFYALVWRTTRPQHSILFGRRVVRQSIARRRNKIVARIAGDEATLRKFEGQLIFFDEDFDWILADDTFFILKPRLFEDAFLNESELKRAVGGNAQKLHVKVPIKNLDEFIERCESVPSMQLKLAKIVESKTFKTWTPDMTALKAYSDKYKTANGPVVTFVDGEMVFEGSLEKQWNILKLLDQAFFTSELTSTKFEATGKHTVS